MTTCKMIIMDMDGTLLTSSGTISQRTKDALIKAQEKGIKVVLASGRSWKTLQAYGDSLQMPKYDGYFIGNNGAAITETATMTHTKIAQMQLDEIKEVFEFAKKYGVEVMGVLESTIYDYIPDEFREMKRQYKLEHGIDEAIWTGGIRAIVADQRKGYDKIYDCKSIEDYVEPVNKMTFCHKEEVIYKLYHDLVEHLGDKYNFARTTSTWAECNPKAVSKGNAIKILQEKFNILPEETFVFGDGENDLSMFAVGHAVAMGNAMDTVKIHADEVTLDNDSDGIAVVIERYL